jgi:hypothetical protein
MPLIGGWNGTPMVPTWGNGGYLTMQEDKKPHDWRWESARQNAQIAGAEKKTVRQKLLRMLRLLVASGSPT